MTTYSKRTHNIKNIANLFGKKLSEKETKEYLIKNLPGGERFITHQIVKCVKYLKSFSLELPSSRCPYGVVAINIPSNEFIESFCNSVFPALAAGNKVCIKTSRTTVKVIKDILERLYNLGLTKRDIWFIEGDKKNFINLIEDNKIDLVYWTGGSKSAKKVFQICMENGVHCIVESEGNGLCYIDKKSNVNLAVKILKRSLNENNGLMCNAIRGVFVHEDIGKKVLLKLKKEIVSNLIPLSEDLKRHVSSIQNKFIDSKKTYAIIINPNDEIVTSNEELFGALLWIKAVSSFEECTHKIHKKHHSLTFTVLSNNPSCLDWAKNLPIPNIFINCDPLDVPMSSAWGGIKKSGSHGPQKWIEKFSFPRIITQNLQGE